MDEHVPPADRVAEPRRLRERPTWLISRAYARATGIKPRSFALLHDTAGEPVPPDVIPPPAHKHR